MNTQYGIGMESWGLYDPTKNNNEAFYKVIDRIEENIILLSERIRNNSIAI